MILGQNKILASFLAVSLNFFFIGCTTPIFSFHQQASNFGFHSQTYQGVGFVHQVYANHKPLNKFLHIYLGGDGTPWEDVERIASDPTPRNPIMLRMMALDSMASVYVGRPCYHGFSQSPGCHSKWWTSDRYSESVVASLSAVLTRISKERDILGVVIFGYSGGGTLAMFLAERLPFVKGVVTIAGNLDIEAWTDYHSFSPLTGSLNPASLPPLGSHIVQMHFLGSQDKVIPPHVVEKAIQNQGEHSQVVIDDIDHQCCWERIWPRLLHEVNHRLDRGAQ